MMFHVHQPTVPFWGYIPEGVHHGTKIQLKGFIHAECHKFEISLYCGDEFGPQANKFSNIALQMKAILSQKEVYYNSRPDGVWGDEEIHRNHQLERGDTFEIEIVAEHKHFKILINKERTFEFYHRMNIEHVKILNVEGHVDLSKIEYRQNHEKFEAGTIYPGEAPPPYEPYGPNRYISDGASNNYRPEVAFTSQTAVSYQPERSASYTPGVYPIQPPYPTREHQVPPPSAAYYPASPIVVPQYVPSYTTPETIVIEENYNHHHEHGLFGRIFGEGHHHHHGHHHGHH